jgi:bacteriocin biosynthesis cyclodehydratase domain-containing protein
MPLGPFGARIGELLASGTRHCVVVADGAVDEAFAAPVAVVVAALWRASPALCEQADQVSYLTGRPWLPVTMESSAIYVGPVIRPPNGPCYRCYARRRAQHDGHRDAASALHGAFDREPQCGPAGYLPHHARLAAGAAENLIEAELGSGSAGMSGSVITIGLPSSRPSTAAVIACHDCARCRGDSAGPQGGTEILQQVLALAGLAAGAR